MSFNMTAFLWTFAVFAYIGSVCLATNVVAGQAKRRLKRYAYIAQFVIANALLFGFLVGATQ